MKAQVAIEYFIIIGVLLVLTLPIISLFFSEYNSILREVNSYNSLRWVIEIDNDIKNIKYQGNGSYIIKLYPYPINLKSISVSTINNYTYLSFNVTDYGEIVMRYPFKIIIPNQAWEGKIKLNISNVNGEIRIEKV